MADLSTAEKLRELVRRQIDFFHKRTEVDGVIGKDDAQALATLIRASAELSAEEAAAHEDAPEGDDETSDEELLLELRA